MSNSGFPARAGTAGRLATSPAISPADPGALWAPCLRPAQTTLPLPAPRPLPAPGRYMRPLTRRLPALLEAGTQDPGPVPDPPPGHGGSRRSSASRGWSLVTSLRLHVARPPCAPVCPHFSSYKDPGRFQLGLCELPYFNLIISADALTPS